jgi:Holliday junction resolvase RusA-like endonuclease
MSIQKITIPNWRPVLRNEADKMHWAIRLRRKKLDEEMIMAFAQHTSLATGKRRVSLQITLGKGQRKFDVDAPWKNVLDGLVKCERLIDDNTKWCELGGVTFQRGIQKTVIVLEDLT